MRSLWGSSDRPRTTTIILFRDHALLLARPVVELPLRSTRLLPLPAHAFDADLILTVISRKRIYARFDLNDYSIPPDAVGHQLTLQISPTRIRILKGSAAIAVQRRSWDRHQVIEDPAHRQVLVEEKRRDGLFNFRPPSPHCARK